MVFTENFRRQHDELLGLVGEISKHLSPAALENDSKEVRSLLSSLSGKITIHLAGEDNSLYPKLLNHDSAEVTALTKKYIDEMGSIKEAFVSYSRKWYNPSDIQNNAEDFINETKGIFAALGKRIESENNELYPMVDKM